MIAQYLRCHLLSLCEVKQIKVLIVSLANGGTFFVLFLGRGRFRHFMVDLTQASIREICVIFYVEGLL